MSKFNLDGIIREIKKGAKELRNGIPKNINDISEELYQIKRLQKTLVKQSKKIKNTALLSLAEKSLEKSGYDVHKEEGEIVASKKGINYLVGFMDSVENWKERLNNLDLKNGIIFTIENPSKEIQKDFRSLNTEFLSSKDLFDWLASLK